MKIRCIKICFHILTISVNFWILFLYILLFVFFLKRASRYKLIIFGISNIVNKYRQNLAQKYFIFIQLIKNLLNLMKFLNILILKVFFFFFLMGNFRLDILQNRLDKIYSTNYTRSSYQNNLDLDF